MKKSKKILLICLFVSVGIFAVIFGYTYSKYTTVREVKGETLVANWSFDGAISNTEDVSTKKISLADTVNKSSIVSGRIAPGTSRKL